MGAQHLLSRDRQRNYYYAIQEYKRQLEQYITEHEMISKYKDRMWFQQLRRQKEDQLAARYYFLAAIIESLEREIDAAKEALHLDYLERERLYNDRNALDKVGRNYLEQLQLF